MHAENEKVIKEIVGSIRKLVRSVYLNGSKTSRRFGLTGSQSAVLRNLVLNGPLSSAGLSRRLYVTPANITGIIDRLEKKGLVDRIRKPGDRRISLITLTEAGKHLSATLPDTIERKLVAGLADLESAEIQRLGRAMEQILQLVDAQDMEAWPLEFSQAAVEANPETNSEVSGPDKHE